MKYVEILQRRIKSLCEAQHLSINKLASISGVPQTTLNSIIIGKSKNPSIITLHRIANAFCMTPSEFFDYPEMNEYEFED